MDSGGVKEVKTASERFLEKISVQENGCWLWVASSHTVAGYGQFLLNGKNVLAHRAAYELFVGCIPEGKLIRHACDVPACVNPKHLLPGTRSENAVDSVNRGRASNGNTARENNAQAKLVLHEAEEIRDNPSVSACTFAKKFKVSVSTIYHIRQGRSWRGI